MNKNKFKCFVSTVHSVLSIHYSDNVFSFMDTFENESMELMTKKTDNEEERKKLSKRREEVTVKILPLVILQN